MTTNQGEDVVERVAKADRDAAAAFLRSDGHPFDKLWAPAVEKGEADWHVLVGAFAKHRHAALTAAQPCVPVEEVEELRRLADEVQREAFNPDARIAARAWIDFCETSAKYVQKMLASPTLSGEGVE